MTIADKVELGFEVGSGDRVEIPIRHMVVTGQTQEAGKTTTLEALNARSQAPAIAFVTKRGERSFADGRRIKPYFREKADWQFVSAVLEATMRERMKFERSWIMRVTKHAKTLADVLRNCKEMKKHSRSAMDESMYMQLEAYLEIIVPRVARIDWAKTVHLVPGINVVDVADREDFPPELQSLVMDAVLRWVYENAHGVVTIIPEAWEFVPQARGSPVKLAAVELIRKGAGLRNYVWLDSQDIGGVDKEILRSCPVWLLGVQRETNEIKRVLDNIPAGVKKPKAADVALLKRGEFFACFGEHVIRTYVRPSWMDEDSARDVARGDATLLPPRPAPIPRPEDPGTPDSLADYYETIAEELRAKHAAEIARLQDRLGAWELQAKVEYQERVKAEEGARLAGFDQGYAAATSTVTASLQGVIRHAQEFVDELREISRALAKNGVPLAAQLTAQAQRDPAETFDPTFGNGAETDAKLDHILGTLEARRPRA